MCNVKIAALINVESRIWLSECDELWESLFNRCKDATG
jgi:hypothetical protein